MAKPKNILFIMFDQLRWDYLGCYGHQHLETPHMDALAEKGVRFTHAYVQSTICGSSRMSTYTGRYVQSHGASWNGIPLKVGEMTMGDHLRNAGMGCWLVGKTHMRPDFEGMERLGLERGSIIGARVAECGFDIFERDDGLAAEGLKGRYDDNSALTYNRYLNAKGYDGDNPWHDYANSAVDKDGNVLSGWFMKHASHPANIAEEDSETPYMTRRGMDFIANATDPWLCHLSYIKPHWPYIVPEPYHNMYGRQHMQRAVRTDEERQSAHPITQGFMKNPIGQAFSRDEVRDAVIPAYMGLIKQCDDQMGVLFNWLEETGRMEDTMIVISSDHGDYLGDHWMGEKMLFHDASVKVPLIIYDPSSEADATRGTTCDALVESIDLMPTFLEVAGGEDQSHIIEGRSLMPILHGKADDVGRDYVISEYDYSATPIAPNLGVPIKEAVLYMVATKEWKLIHCEGGFPPMLYDLVNDPDELVDLGESADHADIRAMMYEKLHHWTRRVSQRTTRSHVGIEAMRGKSRSQGIVLGLYDESDTPEEFTVKYRSRKAKIVGPVAE